MKFEESENLELKQSLSEKEAAGCDLVAFANRNGGVVYFGISNNGVVGGIQTPNEKTARELAEFYNGNIEPKIYPSVQIETVSGKQVISVRVEKSDTPHHTFKGVPYIRSGPTSPRMSQSEYQKRLLKYRSSAQDYSSKIIPEATINDLSVSAIKSLRKLLDKSGRFKRKTSESSNEQLLIDLQLLRNDKLTLAALVLLGKEDSLKRFLPYCEIRFGYKISESEIRNQDTEIFLGGYLLYYEKIWEKINLRNITLNIPTGMSLTERKSFDEETIREALNNAVIHRDYSHAETIFLFQYEQKIVIKSPGGLPDGVTIDNIIDQSKTRNKLLADVLFKCQLVEQFGSGVNLMFRQQLSLGKNPPNYQKTDENHVFLELDGMIQDLEFAKYVFRVADKKHKQLNDEELIVLNNIKNNKSVKSNDVSSSLEELGLIERLGHKKWILSKEYYTSIKHTGEYTRKRGLDKQTNKMLILEHLKQHKKGYVTDLVEAVKKPKLTVNKYLSELRKEGKITLVGNPQASRGSNRVHWVLK